MRRFLFLLLSLLVLAQPIVGFAAQSVEASNSTPMEHCGGCPDSEPAGSQSPGCCSEDACDRDCPAMHGLSSTVCVALPSQDSPNILRGGRSEQYSGQHQLYSILSPPDIRPPIA